MPGILIVDDDPSFRESLAETLAGAGWAVHEATDPTAARRLLARHQPDLVILDLRLGADDGMNLLRHWKEDEETRSIPVIVLTGYASSQNTIEAMQLGAFEHLTKPVTRETLLDTVRRALRVRASEHGAEPSPPPPPPASEPLVGACPPMREVQKLIGRVAPHDATVLITGETGTGKEMVARAIHRFSPRAARPMVAVNCAAIPRELLESELFGHVKGAFTGAVQTRAGKFVEAHGGALFLDEIGDMPLPMQAKLLRVLQEKTIQPVGSDSPRRVDVRVIAATHRDLPERVAAGAFRQDLFYRLNVFRIHLPPLRERGEDIILLAHALLQRLPGGSQKSLHPGAQRVLRAHSWPGNVRELHNVLQLACVMAEGNLIRAEHIRIEAPAGPALDTLPPAWSRLTLDEAVRQLETLMVREALRASGGNKSEAATRLGIHRQRLYDLVRRTQPGT